MNDSDIIDGLILSLGKKEYGFDDLKYLTEPFRISESNLRTHLSRMIQKGFYESRKEGRAAFYRLSEKGRSISGNVALSFDPPDWGGWDGSWQGILFSVPESDKPLRHKIRVKLGAYRFAPWYDGFWIRPYHALEKVDAAFSADRHPECRVIRFTDRTPIAADEAGRLWDLPGLTKELREGLEILEAESSVIPDLSAEDALVKRIEIGNRIVTLLFKDPLLPPPLLPSGWPGDDLRKRFKQWDQRILFRSKPYWKKIFRRTP